MHILITEVIRVVSNLFSYMNISYLTCELKELGRHLYLRLEDQGHLPMTLNYLIWDFLVVGLIISQIWNL